MNRPRRPALATAFLLALLPMSLAAAVAAAAPAADAQAPAFPPRRFELQDPDRAVSPLTGMTRRHWLQCGRFILEGAFQHVKSIDDPMLFPKVPGVSYPTEGYDQCTPERLSAAIFEGVARTFNIAAPLIADDPDITINGIRLADYYKHQVLRLTDPTCPYFIGDGREKPSPVQQTCELGNLALWMSLSPEVLWDRFTPAEKDQVAHVMQGWASGWTKTHNWRWFNVMMMTFLKRNGYEIDEQLLRNHLDHLLMLESGEGWFRDKSHDYYTAHVYQLYGSVWNRLYGWEHEPARAAEIDRQFARFMENYPAVFSRAGKVNMWGRSILYRMGASASLPAAFLRGRPSPIDPGFARRLASGALLQFVTHPDFFENGVPALGFYGHFEPAIQGYSCAASPFWMFMNFTALTLPEDDPFWTAPENEGFWPELAGDVRTTFLPGAGLLVANHGSTGATELINGKIHDVDPSYCRLSYHTEFPWEATSDAGATAAEISLDPLESKRGPELPETINLAGYRDGVFYRQAVYKVDARGGTPCFVDMADVVIPGGRIGVRRFRKVSPAVLYEGHYGLPHVGAAAEVQQRTVDGKSALVARIPGRQLAVTNYQGWDAPAAAPRTGLHPEAAESTLLYLSHQDEAKYGAPALLVSIMLHQTGDAPWTDDRLQPIAALEPLGPGAPVHLGPVRLTLKDGKSYVIDFTGIDGSSSR